MLNKKMIMCFDCEKVFSKKQMEKSDMGWVCFECVTFRVLQAMRKIGGSIVMNGEVYELSTSGWDLSGNREKFGELYGTSKNVQ